ncbi:MAG: hypothetical protein OFPII_12460 [Osedax symbiont Rs1]|nr:MAG: hypothetical protein OFPII_12460 [Osedax symbiont Rs1]
MDVCNAALAAILKSGLSTFAKIANDSFKSLISILTEQYLSLSATIILSRAASEMMQPINC